MNSIYYVFFFLFTVVQRFYGSNIHGQDQAQYALDDWCEF